MNDDEWTRDPTAEQVAEQLRLHGPIEAVVESPTLVTVRHGAREYQIKAEACIAGHVRWDFTAANLTILSFDEVIRCVAMWTMWGQETSASVWRAWVRAGRPDVPAMEFRSSLTMDARGLA